MGLPVSSSHSLIGSMVGVGLAWSVIGHEHHFGDGVNWTKVKETLAALAISPIIGFVSAANLLLLAKAINRWPTLYREPAKDAPPPPWSLRGLLIFTCTAVSFGHGSNDGQKGMGLLLLILIGVLPGAYATTDTPTASVRMLHDESACVAKLLDARAASAEANGSGTRSAFDDLSLYTKVDGPADAGVKPSPAVVFRRVSTIVGDHSSLADLPVDGRATLRKDICLATATIAKLVKQHDLPAGEQGTVDHFKSRTLDPVTHSMPLGSRLRRRSHSGANR